MKKFKVWHIDAYSGFSDYDGPMDCNIHKDIIMDACFSKKDVVEMYYALLGGRSTAIAKCECIGYGEGEYEAPLTEDFKRYTITEDGRKFFDKDLSSNESKEQQYWALGMKHIFDIYLDIITHKNAKLSCDFLHKFNPYEKYPTNCYSKVLTTELNTTDISIGGLLHILGYSMPNNDPDFKEREHQYYDVEFPKQYQEDRLKNIDIEKEKFRRENKRKPNKKDMEEIIHNVEYNMSRFYHPGVITPSIYPEYNCVEVEVSESINDINIDEYVRWLKSIDIFTPVTRLPNGTVVEYRKMSPSEWKHYMVEK